jgi:ABC-type dipeptide/oligopeptide/nickel transport system permease subunit
LLVAIQFKAECARINAGSGDEVEDPKKTSTDVPGPTSAKAAEDKADKKPTSWTDKIDKDMSNNMIAGANGALLSGMIFSVFGPAGMILGAIGGAAAYAGGNFAIQQTKKL